MLSTFVFRSKVTSSASLTENPDNTGSHLCRRPQLSNRWRAVHRHPPRQSLPLVSSDKQPATRPPCPFQRLTALYLTKEAETDPEADSDPDWDSQADGAARLPESLRGGGVPSLFAIMRAAAAAPSFAEIYRDSSSLHGSPYSFLQVPGLEMQYSISIYVKAHKSESDSQLLLRRDFLATLLRTATQLKDLSLDFGQPSNNRICRMNIIGLGTWYALEKPDILGLNFHL